MGYLYAYMCRAHISRPFHPSTMTVRLPARQVLEALGFRVVGRGFGEDAKDPLDLALRLQL
jgi:hypothetical protein